MKTTITLIFLTLLLQVVAFNLPSLPIEGSEKIYINLYDKINSLCWVVFSCCALRISKEIKVIGKEERYVLWVGRLKLTISLFMALSICPAINEWFGEPIQRLMGNFIYGIVVSLYYILIFIAYTVKLRISGRR